MRGCLAALFLLLHCASVGASGLNGLPCALVPTQGSAATSPTLVLIIGLFDFLNIVQAGLSDPNWIGLSMEGYVFSALVYWIFCYAMSLYSAHLERKLSAGRNR